MNDDRGNVLIIDDEEMIRVVLSNILTDENYTVHTADGADQAFELLKKQEFDLVLSDVMMPGVSGFDILKHIRMEYTQSQLPVVMVTAIGRSEDVVEALELGANDYVTKPVDMPVILARIKSLISRKKAEEALKELTEELESRVAIRTAELQSVNDQLHKEISERKQAEEQFRQSQKMEAFGKLAGGVAHDFNNLLTVINGYSQLALSRIEKDDTLHAWVEEINRSGERAVGLTRQLLAFSRRQVLQPKVLDLNVSVVEMEKMLRRLIGEDIDLSVTLASDLGAVKADPGQLEQVVMNLAVNARDAMPDGGQICIETENVVVSNSDANQLEVSQGNYVAMHVIDTGLGMDEATKAQIFEPFFTTKEEGKGTGLGLSTVFGIVKQSDGAIEVRSKIGQGTCFTIYLPIEKKKSSSQLEKSVNLNDVRGEETILLVEDEDAVRKLTEEVLTDCGYTVLSACQGDEALEKYGQSDVAIDLLLTDVVMPGMNGRELALRMKSSHPEVSVLFMSGYAENAIVRDGIVDPDIHLIEKPFEPEDLMVKIRHILDNLVNSHT